MELNPRPPAEPVQIGTGDPMTALPTWIADGRVDEAVNARGRQRWLERQAAEEATLAGVLLDLAERHRPVTITTTGGHRLSGAVTAVGADFGALRDHRLGDALVPSSRIAIVRPAPGDGLPTGDRRVSITRTFRDAMMELAPERPDCIVAVGAEQLHGELRAASPELVALALDGDRRELVHVSVAAIDHVIALQR